MSDPEKLQPDEKPKEPPEQEGFSERKKGENEIHQEAHQKEIELARLLEPQIMQKEREEAENERRSSEAPGPNPELPKEDPMYAELEKAFAPIKTDHIRYNFLRRALPNFIRVCEESRLGRRFTPDILWLALGIADSLASVVALSGHLVIDTARVIIHPVRSYTETKNQLV